MLDVVPIGVALSLLIDQVIATANAINDVLITKESFRSLSTYLRDIEPILKEMQHLDLDDTPAVRHTLGFLKRECSAAEALVRKYGHRGKIYSLLFCRQIAKEVQVATENLGNCLAFLAPIANSQVLYELSQNVNMLQAEPENVAASQFESTTLEMLNRRDRNFVNNMLRAAGVTMESSEMKRELESLCKDKEEAAAVLEKPEDVYLLNRVIELLLENSELVEYDAFICPITKEVMVDPVNLHTGTTCERAAIEAGFKEGCKEDPVTGRLLEDLTLKPNNLVRESIQQWRRQNCCIKIVRAKKILQTGDHHALVNALCDLEEVTNESKFTKDWIAMEGLIDDIVPLLGHTDIFFKLRVLQTLLAIVERHSHNKEKVVAAGGFDHIVKCLGLDSNVCGAAINLLFELLHVNDEWHQTTAQENSTWNEDFCRKLKEQDNTIIAFLVCTVFDRQYPESSNKAEDILFQLCVDDDDMISHAASCHWFKPLVWRLSHGPESSKLLMIDKLEKMRLIDEDIKQLGEVGVIKPLVQMTRSGADSNKLAFVLLAKLSTSYENRRLIVEAGAFPLILKQISSPLVSPLVREKCSEIFEKLTTDSKEFLSNVGHAFLELEQIVDSLVAELKNPSNSKSFRKSLFKTLLNICNHERVATEKTIATTDGISSILPLLEDSEQEIRELALQLIHQFSEKAADTIADWLLEGTRLRTLMALLEDDKQPQLQVVAVSLLANLQKSSMKLTNTLAELRAIPVLLKLLDEGSNEAKEFVLDSLFGFVNPTNIDMQRTVVNAGAYPFLVSMLKSKSRTARAKAAELISDLSSNSPKLTTTAKTRHRCFCFGKQAPTCEVHGGICGVESSFCLLEAGALPNLVSLLRERDEDAVRGSLLALKTLVQEGLALRSAKVFCRIGAIDQMLNVLERRETNEALKEEVIELLDKAFDDNKVAGEYSVRAREVLVFLTEFHNENRNESLREKAAKLMGKLQRCSQPGSMPPLPKPI